MLTISMLAGGTVGLFSAIVALAALPIGLGTAFLVYVAVTFVVTALGLASLMRNPLEPDIDVLEY